MQQAIEVRDGETVRFTVTLLERDGTPFLDPGTAVVSLLISDARSGTTLATFTTVTGHVTLSSGTTFLFVLQPADIAALGTGTFWFEVWTEKPGDSMNHVYGTLSILEATKP